MTINNIEKMTTMTSEGKVQAEKSTYLKILTEEWRCEEEIQVRIILLYLFFIKLKNYLIKGRYYFAAI